MNRDQSYGFAIFLLSIIVLIVYAIAFFAPLLGLPAVWREWAIGLPVLLFVVLVLVIAGWIGWTMLTTPPPAPLEPEPTPSSSTPTETKQ